jgi:hypothetical protein
LVPSLTLKKQKIFRSVRHLRKLAKPLVLNQALTRKMEKAFGSTALAQSLTAKLSQALLRLKQMQKLALMRRKPSAKNITQRNKKRRAGFGLRGFQTFNLSEVRNRPNGIGGRSNAVDSCA